MCGIAGLWLPRGAAPGALGRTAFAMQAAIAHRGPDDHAVWVDEEAGIALAHRRLAIIDLSPAGRQPMASATGRFVVSYNGEVYNYRELASELGQPHLARGSDTAVLLACIEAWGIERTLPKLDAMFALALWDRAERVLWLARDHAGIKPLAWHEDAKGVRFASELTAIEVALDEPASLDEVAAAGFLASACVAAPRSILKGVRKLPPGGLARIDESGSSVRLWYDVAALARVGAADPFRGSFDEAVERLDALVAESVRRQLVGDVPVGAFLSGGIDSSSVLAAQVRAAPGIARAFTIGVRAAGMDESGDAARIASHLGVEHVVLPATEADALALVEQSAALHDEPFADPSQVPTLLLSRLARAHVTVALSGDGGDELFGGYRRHVLGLGAWRWLRTVPRPLRSALAAALAVVPPGWWDGVARPMVNAERVAKVRRALAARDVDSLHASIATTWSERAALATADAPEPSPPGLDPLAAMRLLDFRTYLPEDVLTKVDRASMSVALEVRVPLLSPAILDFAWRLPSGFLVEGGKGKRVLRGVLARHVPEPLWDRPKTGFGVPVAAWLRGGLREWADARLSPSALAGLPVDPRPVRAAWERHQKGAAGLGTGLWTVMMLSAWAEARRGRAAAR